MTSSGVDTTIYSPHSTRAASVSQVSRCSALINTILATGGWSTLMLRHLLHITINHLMIMTLHLLSMKVILFQINYVVSHGNCSQVLEYMY